MYPEPERTATPEDFRDSLSRFRSEVLDFFAGIAPEFSPNGIEDFDRAVQEFDERLFYMSLGVKTDLDPTDYKHLVDEVENRKAVIVEGYNNPDIIYDYDSLAAKIPMSTNLIRAAMIGNRALINQANEQLKKLDVRRHE